MEYTTLGRTGLKISKIGFGAWGIGGGTKKFTWDGMWKADDAESEKSLREAYEQGITFYDTAFEYGDGHSERLINKVLSGKDIVVATKVRPLDLRWPATNKNIEKVFPKQYILDSARESYKNLGRTIDVLQLHVWLDDWMDSKNWREAFVELKKEGIVRYVGVSINDHDPDSALKIAASGEIDTIQVIYNIFDQSPEDQLFGIAKANNVGIIARVPLDEGGLSGKLSYSSTFSDFRKKYFQGSRLKEVVDRAEAIKKHLVNDKRTLPQIALKFCIREGAADVVIPGMRNSKHVGENIQSLNIELSAEDLSCLKEQRWVRNFY
jgi:aryl-alcohol dehydrogenase-like predicted oxidoreductase